MEKKEQKNSMQKFDRKEMAKLFDLWFVSKRQSSNKEILKTSEPTP